LQKLIVQLEIGYQIQWTVIGYQLHRGAHNQPYITAIQYSLHLTFTLFHW